MAVSTAPPSGPRFSDGGEDVAKLVAVFSSGKAWPALSAEEKGWVLQVAAVALERLPWPAEGAAGVGSATPLEGVSDPA